MESVSSAILKTIGPTERDKGVGNDRRNRGAGMIETELAADMRKNGIAFTSKARPEPENAKASRTA